MNKNRFIPPDEQELIDLLKDKNQACFNYLYDTYSGALYTVILQIILEKQLASDILQNAFVKIWADIDGYNISNRRLFTWMLQIARNLSVAMLHSKSYENKKYHLFTENTVDTVSMYHLAASHIKSIG